MKSAKNILLCIALIVGGIQTRCWGQELFEEAAGALGAEVDRMYVKGLQFLAQTQTVDGRWPDSSYGGEPGVIALAVAAILAHGDDPNVGPYSQQIKRSLDFILSKMNKDTGYIGTSMYNHGFSTLALAEAYGVVNDPRIGPALEKAVQLIVGAQKKNPFGAWRYSPESMDADTTVTGAQVVALFAARNAGIAVPEEAIQKGLKYLRSCQTPDGGIGYTSASGPNAARTAIATLCFALAKEKNTKAYQNCYAFLQKATPDNHYRQYYQYYAAQAFFQASPEDWQRWNQENIRNLAAAQNPDGSWDGQFGAAFGTAASLLSLALNYRFLPIYER